MKQYDSSDIKVLKGLEAVRKRPGMYIGNTDDGVGLHHMIFEIIDNSIDEALSGYCNTIDIVIYKDNSVSVKDNGRGIPVDIHKEENISAAELIMTTLHAGGKFDNEIYKISGGLHGVGISVVNALSSKLQLLIYRNECIYEQIYYSGIPEKPLSIIGKSNTNGTFIRFWPDLNIFTGNIIFEYNIIYNKILELSFLNPNILISIYDERINKKEIINNKGGIKSFIDLLMKNKSPIHNNTFYINKNKDNINLEVALKWNSSFTESVYCFTNNIKQKEGGTHLSGFRSAITKTINNSFEKENIQKKNKINILGEDTREGMIAIISVKLSNPKFSSQTKDKLISSEVKSIVESLIIENLTEFFLENSNDFKLILNKIIQASKAREASKKAKEINRKKEQNDIFNLLGKLSDCQEKAPNYSELYLVEGDSAGGSAKQGRNRKNQAILPLKGKIINVEKSKIEKIFLSQEIMSIITAIGCGIKDYDFNIEKIRYKKIIIMTDADIDGSHIRTLLLTFFYRYMPILIKHGYLFIAQPPLYKVKYNKNEKYILNDNELIEFKIDLLLKDISIYNTERYLDKLEIKDILILYIEIDNLIKKLSNKYPEILIKNIFLNSKNINFNNYNEVYNWADILINKINNKNLLLKSKFYIKENFSNNLFEIIFKIYNFGIYSEHIIDFNFINSYEYKKFIEFNNKTNKININDNFYLKLSNKDDIKIYSIIDIIKILLDESRINVSIQRYKGLGEMNPKQLWETTMNPNNRNILKIEIKDAIEANNIFSILMGDNVESRKEFIETNALYSENLDI